MGFEVWDLTDWTDDRHGNLLPCMQSQAQFCAVVCSYLNKTRSMTNCIVPYFSTTQLYYSGPTQYSSALPEASARVDSFTGAASASIPLPKDGLVPQVKRVFLSVTKVTAASSLYQIE